MATREDYQDILGRFLTGFAKGQVAKQQSETSLYGDIRKERIKSMLEQNDPYRQAQIAQSQASAAFTNKLMQSMESGSGGDLVYRDPETGTEIPKDIALKDIQEGKQYQILRRVPSRQGIREELVSKPEDLSTEEKTYLITSKRVGSTLDNLLTDIHPRLEKIKGNKEWQAIQAETMPFLTIRNQDIQDYKSAITQLKSDIPFLRGGKNLTKLESKRVDILLNPFGKTKETLKKDIERFKTEFGFGEDIMQRGIRAINRPITTKKLGQIPNQQNSFSTPEEADNSGLPTGSIVLVDGRRYQI